MMLPTCLLTFLEKVLLKTEAGELAWLFDAEGDDVSVGTPEFSMTVRHDFNRNLEANQFMVFYRGGMDQQAHRFVTNDSAEGDYLLLQRLFNAAQATSTVFPF
jgi:hypothetical protein